MRRHVGGHTYGDTVAAVEEQHWSLCGKNHRLGESLVKIGAEIHRILVEVGKDILCQALQLGLCITHGRRGVAVHAAKVTLPENQRITHAPGLGQTHHGVINAAVAVRMIFTQDIAHDTGRLLGTAAVADAKAVHTEQHAAVHRLHAVPYIGEGSRNDNRHRIIYVRALHLALYIDRDNPTLKIVHFFYHFQFSFCVL